MPQLREKRILLLPAPLTDQERRRKRSKFLLLLVLLEARPKQETSEGTGENRGAEQLGGGLLGGSRRAFSTRNG